MTGGAPTPDAPPSLSNSAGRDFGSHPRLRTAQQHQQALFVEAKEKAERDLGEEYATIHDVAMAEPLEQALRHGNVLAEARHP